MMEFKPGDGFSSSGYTDPKKTERRKLVSAALFLLGIFGMAAMVFGWWSILVDAAILAYLSWIGKRNNKNKALDK